jgi:hypothetical protein
MSASFIEVDIGVSDFSGILTQFDACARSVVLYQVKFVKIHIYLTLWIMTLL